MSVYSLRTPAYRFHKPSGQAVVTLNGRDFYLGRFNTPESRADYDRLIAEWLANGRRLPQSRNGQAVDLTINEILLAYLRYAETYYTSKTVGPQPNQSTSDLPSGRSGNFTATPPHGTSVPWRSKLFVRR